MNPKNYFIEKKEELLKRDGLPNSPYMELYFIKNRFFMEKNEILENIKNLKSIPCYLVQGRYDLICPPVNAYNLHINWNSSELCIVNTAGHSSSDEGIVDNLLKGLKKLTDQI